MNKIKELFIKDIDRTIEEVIKVDQSNDSAVRIELDEYIATDYIREQYRRVYEEIASGAAKPREGIGIWVSGFFGSGKSSFAKILGYTVANRSVGGQSAASLFKPNLEDPKACALLDSITTRIPFHSVIFDVSMDRGVRVANERITEILYKQLLGALDYSEDFDLAELEITLEHDSRLTAFEDTFQKLHGKPWKQRRLLGLAVNEASAALHKLDPQTYSSADSYAKGIGKGGRADIDANKLAARAFELAARRRPGSALIFIIDEVGQYVSRSVEKMLDLQGVVQAFGVEGRNRVERKQAVSPCWIVVTSQEKLDEVVNALDSKKIELARLQDRFRVTVDLKQSDIAEITRRRVLDKTKPAIEVLKKLYAENSGRLDDFTKLERTTRQAGLTAESFIGLYPYLPYQIDLCVDIVAGLRLRRGAHRHVGGSNRTIIKQVQEMLINPRTNLGNQLIGALVTLDRVYELLYLGSLLPSEVSREIDEAARHPARNDMAIKVLKAIALLDPVKDLPRTPHNLAVVLYPAVNSPSILPAVKEAIKVLEADQLIRNSEEGYKLLTSQEKNWDTRRNGHDPREADRNRIRRELLKEVFADPKLRAYRFDDLKNFRSTLTIEGETVESDGDIPLNLLIAYSLDGRAERLREAREESTSRRDDLFWVLTETPEIQDLTTEVFRSRTMVEEFDRLASQQRLSPEESSCLSEEKNRRDTHTRNLRTKLAEAVRGGTGFFQGVQHDSAALGITLVEVFHRLFDKAVPSLYSKLEIGVLALDGNEPEKVLTAVNLNGLPPVFHHDRPERSLVIQQSGKYVPNLGSDLTREIFDYLRKEHAYGNKVTGKMLETRFAGLGYGWERDAIRLALALLFRGGAVEVTHQGRKHRNYSDPASRPPFVNNPAFRAASFAPRETLDLKVLAKAAQAYEEITGKDVNIEEGDIAQAFKQVASQDREKLLPVVARLQALKVPGWETAKAHLDWVDGILEMAPDDCVRTLSGEGKAFLDGRKQTAALESLASEENLKTLERARRVLDQQWPLLATRNPTAELSESAAAAVSLLGSDEALRQLTKISQAIQPLTTEYVRLYRSTFEQREEAFRTAVDHVKGLADWTLFIEDPEASASEQTRLLAPLASRLSGLTTPELSAGETVCRRTGASVPQMESDLAAVEGLSREVVRRLQEWVEPEEKIERFRVAQHFSGKITTEEELDTAMNDLRGKLSKLLSQGVKIVLE
jgi:hypothetical protein